MKHAIQWDQVILGDIAVFKNGGAWKADEYAEDGVPVVRVTDCQNGTVNLSACKYLPISAFERYSKHELLEGDLVIATVGSHPTQPGSVVGRPVLIPRHASGALLNQNAVCVRPKDSSLNKRFLSYLAKSPFFREYIIACARGSANQVRMAIGLLKKAPITLPPLSTQRKIVGILSAYDDLIENNLRRIKILEEMAQNLYREWFVKFRFPGHQRAPFVESSLGRIPEGWEVAALGSVADIRWGDTSTTKKSYVDKGYRAYSAAGPDGFLDHFDFDRDGIVLSAIGANCGLTWFEKGKWSCIKNTIRFWAIDPRISTEYLYYVSFGKDFWPKRGAAQPFISQGDAKGIPIAIPTINIGQQFQSLVEPIIDFGRSLSSKNIVLCRTRDMLLPKLISGELDVSGLEISIPEEIVS